MPKMGPNQRGADTLISQSTGPPPSAKRIKLFLHFVQEAEDGANFGRHVRIK